MSRSAVIGIGTVLALAGITACGGSSGPRSQSAARTRGLAATATAAPSPGPAEGWIANPAITRHYEPPADDQVAFARRWGMRVAVEDVARVVRAARAGGRHVVLGGHSLGGWIATAYATWGFGGRAGARDLDGLVLIDGASGPQSISAARARRALAEIRRGSPFLVPAGAHLPWTAGVLTAVGSRLAVLDPDAPSLLQRWPLLPAAVKAPVPVTNLAQLGYTVDTDTSPASLAAGQAHLGGLAASGGPR